MDEKTFQKKYLELQIIDNQIMQIQKQIKQLDDSLMEIEFIRMNLDDFKKMKKGSEIFAPIANGIFVKAELKENDELLVNVGNNVVVKKNVEETKKLLSDQLNEIIKARNEMVNNLIHMNEHAEKLEKDLKEMAKTAEK